MRWKNAKCCLHGEIVSWQLISDRSITIHSSFFFIAPLQLTSNTVDFGHCVDLEGGGDLYPALISRRVSLSGEQLLLFSPTATNALRP